MRSRRLYFWQAINAQGKMQQGELITTEKNDVYQKIIEQELQPVVIKAGKYIPAHYWHGSARILFIRQLATLLKAGLPLLDSLQLLARENDSPAWRCIMQEVSKKVANGQAFSEVIADYPMIFSPLYHQLISIGELTGKLDQCCEQLAQQQEQQQQLQKKIARALRYPVFICMVAMFVSMIMLVIVLPEFAKIYQSSDTPLPWLTSGLLYISHALISYGPYITLLLIVLFIFYRNKLRNLPAWQQREQALLLRLPVISLMVRGSCLSQIFQTLAMTQQAGLTLIAGLDATALSINNIIYQREIINIRKQISHGIAFHSTLIGHPLFPSLCQQLIRVGEESGSLDIVLKKLAGWYQQQAYEVADSLVQILEPTLMLIVGGITGILVIAMYLPIFQLGNVVG